MDRLKSGTDSLGIKLNTAQLASFETYYHELIEWNQKFNLTAITDYDEVQTRHFLDSLTAVLADDFTGNPDVLDIGTGAGFPGVPLKIVFPGIHLTLIEATAKKTRFLEYLLLKLGLNDTSIIVGRAEELAQNILYREKFDIVIARAVASLPALAEIALPFCKIKGKFVAYKKGDIAEELASSGKAVQTMGGTLAGTVVVNHSLFSDNRFLVVVNKSSSTPGEYPRRPGIPEKKPILP